jgi:hypothetical protein
MHSDVYQDWSRERDAVEQEMTLLLKSAPGASLEDRRVLQIQFSALVERRDAAMRRLLQLSLPIRHSMPGPAPTASHMQSSDTLLFVQEAAERGGGSATPRIADGSDEEGEVLVAQ